MLTEAVFNRIVLRRQVIDLQNLDADVRQVRDLPRIGRRSRESGLDRRR